MKAGDVLVLFGLALLFYLLAVKSFSARNVAVGAWPWQKARKVPE